jgi:Kef-type K+ transport system membrane component KefB
LASATSFGILVRLCSEDENDSPPGQTVMMLAVFNLWHVWHIAATGLGLLLSVLASAKCMVRGRW